MRQLAWLNTAPKPKDPKARIQDGRTRLQRLRDEGADIPLPPCPHPQLIEFLMEIGPVVPGGMGLAPIGWQDIAAWQSCTGLRLSPWAVRRVRHLSTDWLSAAHRAEDEGCPSPMAEASADAARRQAASLDDKLRAAMMMMTNNGAKP